MPCSPRPCTHSPYYGTQRHAHYLTVVSANHTAFVPSHDGPVIAAHSEPQLSPHHVSLRAANHSTFVTAHHSPIVTTHAEP